MELTKDEIMVIVNLLEQVNLPVGQTEKILLPILVKLRAGLVKEVNKETEGS